MVDIRQVSPEEKRAYIDKVLLTFGDIRQTMTTLALDMESSDLMVQASAVWISGNLCTWFSDFMTQIREIEKSKAKIQDIQDEIKETANVNPA